MGRRVQNRMEKCAEYEAYERRQTEEEDQEEEDQENDEEEAEATDEIADEEDELDEEEAPKKKPAKEPKPRARSRSRAAKTTRMKMVWGVFNNSKRARCHLRIPPPAGSRGTCGPPDCR